MIKALINEIKRHNDLKEKELDLKILSLWDYEQKWGVYPVQPVTTQAPQVVVAPTYEQVSTSSINKHPWISGYF